MMREAVGGQTQVDGAQGGGSRGEEDTLIDTGRQSLQDTVGQDGSQGSRSGGRAGSPETVVPDAIGRHEVLEVLGSGGMGVVFAAHDPELDRKIAIKLVHGGEAGGSENTAARARMRREAQAMAKLSHQNVITVYDVGEHEGQLYIAMELVQGLSVRQWLKGDRRPRFGEILDVFIAAGRGLAAAHAAGLVHRDFKPDNVMVTLADGGSRRRVERVRVLDFGLAAPVHEEVTTEDVQELSAYTGDLVRMTRTGALLGTPAYMSPEQLEGRSADAPSDQFSFCVALWEALYGQRPFSGDNLASLAYAVTQGRVVQPPKRRGVPRWIRRILERGLSRRPEDRYADMPSLLHALAAGRRRRYVVAGAGMLTVGAAAAALAWPAPPDERCTGAQEQLTGLWDEPSKAALQAGITGSDAPYAASTWAQIETRLDTWAQQWVATHRAACEATRIRGETSESMLDLQMRCLHEARADAKSLLGTLAQGQHEALEHAVAAVASLPQPQRCTDLDAVQRDVPLPGDPATAKEVQRIRDEIRRAHMLELEGKPKEAVALAADLHEQAEALAFEPLIAEIAYALGELQQHAGEFEAARSSLERTYNLALGLGHDALARDVASVLVKVVGFDLGRPQDAQRWIDAAQAMARRTRPQPEDQARILLGIAAVHQEKGEYPQSEALGRQAETTLVEAYGEDDPRVGAAIDQVAMALALQGKLPEAQEAFERGLAHAQTLGEEHPRVAVARGNLGVALAKQGNLEEALEQFEQAAVVIERVYGPEHPDLARMLSNIGGLREETGRFEQALAAHRRALEIREKKLGPDHPDLASSYHNLGNVRSGQGDHEAAIELYDRALRIKEQAYGPEHPSLISTLGNKGSSLLRSGQKEVALQSYRRALEIAEAVHGPDALRVAYQLTNVAQALLQSGKPKEAVPMFERSLAIRVGKPIDSGLMGATRFGLAQALTDSGARGDRALQLAKQAREDYLASQHAAEGEVEIIDRWLAANNG